MTECGPPELPAGTTTFLLAAVERTAQSRDLLDDVLGAHGGARVDVVGIDDGVLAAFVSATEAVAAALAVQLACEREESTAGLTVRARIGLHTAEIHGRDDRDAALRRCARLCDVAHGGQTLLSPTAAALVTDRLPERSGLVDLGLRRLRDLSRPEPLFELRHPDLPGPFPLPRSLDTLPTNLPVQLSRFVGRDAELVEVQKLLGERRLLTLTGAGGCGKTRLALQTAAGLVDRWPDGVWWVEMGSVTDPDLVTRLVASVVGALPVGDPLTALTAQLRTKHLLLCLDNCEHLLDTCAALADTLLRGCAGVTVLATSRERLGIPGETVWPVPSLVTDDAATLFTDRAGLVRPGFTTTPDDRAVRTVCERLEGIPLAIELAAAWTRVLSPTQIAARLEDRFRLLADGPRVATERHRTLAASIDWSHELLDEPDRVVFRRLSVFAGGFTLDAAEAVCGVDVDMLAAVGRLVDKSMVVVADDGRDVRYRLLDTIREYAWARLVEAGEADAVRDRHLEHYLAFAQAAEPELERDQDTWRLVLEAEHDNLRAALRWGVAAVDPDRGRRLAAALAQFWLVHGHTEEGIGFLQRAITLLPEDRSTLQASLHSGVGLLAVRIGWRAALAGDAAERGLAIAAANGDDRNRARCLMVAGHLLLFTDFSGARALCRQAQHYGRAVDDAVATDWAQVVEATALTEEGRHDEAEALARPLKARAIVRGAVNCASYAGSQQMWAALFTGDLRRAEELAREAVGLAEPLRDWFTVGLTTCNLAWVKGLAGEVDAGWALLDPVFRIVADAGTEMEQLSWLAPIPGKLRLWGGDFDGALAWLERATRFGEPRTDNWVVARTLPDLAGALRRLGRHDEARVQAERARALSEALGAPHLRAEALAELAFLAAADGDAARAEDLHHHALAIRVEYRLRTFTVDSLDALAGLAAAAESAEEAVRLLAASAAAREAMGYPRLLINKPDVDTALAAARAALGEDGLAAAWAQGAALSLEDAIAYVTRARGARERPSTGWASLTPTELHVVELVVEGLSNSEVGTRLFMSLSTVKTHLLHIYRKLDITNRTELATRAHHHRSEQ